MENRPPIRTVNLTATCGNLDATIRFLKGALRACGGEVLNGGAETEHIRTVEFECRLVALVDIYCVLAMSGLYLARQSHYAVAALFQVLRYQLASADSLLRFSLLLFDAASDPGIHGRQHSPAEQG